MRVWRANDEMEWFWGCEWMKGESSWVKIDDKSDVEGSFVLVEVEEKRK